MKEKRDLTPKDLVVVGSSAGGQEPFASSLEINQLRRFNEVLLRSLPVGVVLVDRAYRIMTANGAARRLLGLREIGIDQDFLHAVRGVPYHQTRTAIDTVFRERDPITLAEIELESISGGNGRYVNMSFALVQIEAGLPDLSIVSVSDVTQQVQVRRQLETIQAEQINLMKELEVTNKRLTEVNKELTDANEGLQVANEELVLTHEELQASIEEFETTNEELQTTNEELETNNEELQATNEELETTNQERLRDVEEEHERLKLIFNNLSMAALALFDAQTGKLIMGSPRYLESAASAHHLEQDTLIGRHWQELNLIPSQEQAHSLWQTALENRTTTHIAQLPYEHANRAKIIWDYTFTPLPDTQKPDLIRFILVSAVDITEQVQIQRELEALDSLKDELLSMTSHELRSPLTAIQGSAQLLQRVIKKQKVAVDGQTRQEQWTDRETLILNTITHQANRMNKLIKEMMDVARIRGKMFDLEKKNDVNIVDLVRHVIVQYTQDKQHTNIVFQSKAETILGTWDEDRIEQVLNNLISNALKYSPADKPIVVKIELDSQNPASEVIVSVCDHGLGIPEEDQAHIFDRFYRVNNGEQKPIEGLGLGLYISHAIVTQHGGRIWLTSHLGEGSTFYFTLPLQQK
jgi:signal transduction histidine kinase